MCALGSGCVRCYSLTSPEKLFEYYSIPNYIRYISVCKQSKNVVGVNVQKAFAMYYSHVLAQIWYSLCFSALWRCVFFLLCFVDSFLFCIPIRFSVDFCCFSFLFPRHSFSVEFGLVFGWHFFLLSLLNTVFNGANVYNRCAYGPMRYNLTENTARICLCKFLFDIFSSRCLHL